MGVNAVRTGSTTAHPLHSISAPTVAMRPAAPERKGAIRMDYHELEKTTVGNLREMAKEYPDVEGTSGMNKEQLIELLAQKLGIEKPHKVVVGIDKSEIKTTIKALKKVRDEALAEKDHKKLKTTRRELHRLRRKLRRAIKITA
jgi:DUF438 domain-containing protein